MPCICGGIPALFLCNLFALELPARREIQTRIGVKDRDLVKNCCSLWFCRCCALVQEAKELGMGEDGVNYTKDGGYDELGVKAPLQVQMG